MVRWLLLALLLASPALAREDELFMEAEAKPAKPYVQQEVRYTIRLYRSSSFQTGYFLDPEVPDAVLETLGEDEPLDVVRQGRTWQMIERRYLLFPQRSGTLEIPPPVFSGRETFAKGAAFLLSVRPRPEAAPLGDWLPARSLTLAEEWRPAKPPYRAGEPLERVVTVTAEGLAGAQIPPLPPPGGIGFQVQRLPAEASHEKGPGGVLGRRVERHLFLAGQAGAIDIPPLRLGWWDVAADGPRVAFLPARRLDIQAPRALAAVPLPAPPPETPREPEAVPVAGRLAPVPGAVAIALGLALSIWLADRISSSPGVRNRRRRRAALDELDAACRTGDARAARRALLDWAQARWPDPPAGLHGLARRLEAPEIEALDAALYGPGAGAAWPGGELRARLLPRLRRMTPAKRHSASRHGLPPL